MASPLRRSTRGARNADPSATTPEPSIASPSASPSKLDRKRKRADDEHMTEAAHNASTGGADNKASSDLSSEHGGADTEGETEAQTTKLQKLPKHIQSLLGLPGSSSTSIRSAKSTDADFDSAAQKAQELTLSQEDTQKLSTILSALGSSDLITTSPQASVKGKLRTANGSSDNKPTLADMLRPGTRLRELSAHLQSLRDPLLSKVEVSRHLQAGHGATASKEVNEDVAKLSNLTLVLGLVDQLASRQRQADTSTDALKGQLIGSIVEERARLAEARNARQKSVADGPIAKINLAGIKPESPSTEGSTANRYALHMRLPRGDYFTKAIPLDKEQLSQLDAAQADLVQISAQSEEQMRTLRRQGLVPTPTLGQRLGRSGHRHRTDSKRAASQQQGRPHPVTFLNYGNYASFAPTYDSSTSSLSYATSSSLWRNSVRAQHSIASAWGEKPFMSYDEEEYEDDEVDVGAPGEPSPSLTTAETRGNLDVEGDISMDALQNDDVANILQSLIQGVDPGSVSKSLFKLDQDELITSHLRFNMMLLHRLQEFQWARLRRSYRPSASGRSSTSAIEDVAPSAEEEATAALLLESLSSLVALQPRAVDLTSNAVEGVVPDASKLRAFSASSGAIDPDLLGDVRDGFWGALDANVVKVTKTGSVISETPLVLRDDVTIRLTADSSGSRAKKSSRRTGPGAGHVEDRGRGALERFAASRTYDHKQDRHDIDPLGAEAGGEREMPSPAVRAAAMSPNARMHGGYAQGGGPGMTPQAQRYAPGPNASYAFASPGGGGMSYQGRPMHQGQGQATRQA